MELFVLNLLTSAISIYSCVIKISVR